MSSTRSPTGSGPCASLRTYDYEVAVLDWRMPAVVGPRRRARDCVAAGHTLPVLMLTARDAPSDRVTGLDEGADDYLVKPFVLRGVAGPHQGLATTIPSPAVATLGPRGSRIQPGHP